MVCVKKISRSGAPIRPLQPWTTAFQPSPRIQTHWREGWQRQISFVLEQINQLKTNTSDFGVSYFGISSPKQGVVHVIGPELGLTQPGMTIVCGDSHTSTHGAFGALAFGIGTSEVEHVLATQCLLQNKPKTMEIRIDGTLHPGVTAKDIILTIINKIGVGGGTGYVIEYTGSAIRSSDHGRTHDRM